VIGLGEDTELLAEKDEDGGAGVIIGLGFAYKFA